MPMTPSGAVQLFDQAANIPLPLMVTTAVDAVVQSANVLNMEYLAVQQAWVALGSPAPAPVQYAITHATIDLRVTLAFNLQEAFGANAGFRAQFSSSVQTGALASLFVNARASASLATYANAYYANRFNLRGEYVCTIRLEIAPVFAPTASGT